VNLIRKNENSIVFVQSIQGVIDIYPHFTILNNDELKAGVKMLRKTEINTCLFFEIIGIVGSKCLIEHNIPPKTQILSINNTT